MKINTGPILLSGRHGRPTRSWYWRANQVGTYPISTMARRNLINGQRFVAYIRPNAVFKWFHKQIFSLTQFSKLILPDWIDFGLYNFNLNPFTVQSSSNFTPQGKEARNHSQIFNRKSISRNTTHRQSYHLQAMLTGVKRRKANTSSEIVNNLKTAMKKTAQTQPRQIKQNQNVLLNYMQRLKPQNLLHKWQKLTKTQRQLTINTKAKIAFW